MKDAGLLIQEPDGKRGHWHGGNGCKRKFADMASGEARGKVRSLIRMEAKKREVADMIEGKSDEKRDHKHCSRGGGKLEEKKSH